MTSIAFSGGIWWFKSKPRRARKRLTINPYAHAPHHIITEATVSPQPTMNMMSSTTHLVSQPTSPRTATVVGRTSSTRSAATTGRLRSSRTSNGAPFLHRVINSFSFRFRVVFTSSGSLAGRTWEVFDLGRTTTAAAATATSTVAEPPERSDEHVLGLYGGKRYASPLFPSCVPCLTSTRRVPDWRAHVFCALG